MEAAPSRQNQGDGTKSEGCRRIWSVKEEEVLICALKDIITKGWKKENGFRGGYLHVLERAIVKAFPGTDIRALPHINSKLHVWKKSHKMLTSILAQRGIDWNAEENMIKAQDDVWDLYLKIDSSARTMRYKTWPYYNDWCQIYGNDPIIIENTEDLSDSDQKINTDSGKKEKEVALEFDCCINEGLDDENEVSVCRPQESETEKKQMPRKRKLSDHCYDDPLRAIADLSESVNVSFGEIIKRLGHEYEVSKARKQVYGELGKIPELSTREKIIVARLLVNKTPDMELFFSLPDDARVVMVKMLLANRL
ncbi:uncharacterized protein [Henckelia pumila]|uniref:uncharacterized protein n=1 Tax=Henckelia pumila TaxID=405737 RepID=UPI003C6E15BD